LTPGQFTIFQRKWEENDGRIIIKVPQLGLVKELPRMDKSPQKDELPIIKLELTPGQLDIFTQQWEENDARNITVRGPAVLEE